MNMYVFQLIMNIKKFIKILKKSIKLFIVWYM